MILNTPLSKVFADYEAHQLPLAFKEQSTRNTEHAIRYQPPQTQKICNSLSPLSEQAYNNA
jgi:hypothetical protein